MKSAASLHSPSVVLLTLAATLALFPTLHAAPKPAKPPKKGAKPKPKPAQETVAPVFFDTVWEYRLGTLYDKEKNIVSNVSGEAQFEKNGKFHQDYYIGSIGNFFKGTYKLNGRKLVTYDEQGKKIFDYTLSVGTNPPVLVMSVFEDDGTKSMDFSLVPRKKKED